MNSKIKIYDKDFEEQLREKILSRQNAKSLSNKPKTKPKRIKKTKSNELELKISQVIQEVAQSNEQLIIPDEPIIFSSKPLTDIQRQKLKEEQKKEKKEIDDFLNQIPNKAIKQTKEKFVKSLKLNLKKDKIKKIKKINLKENKNSDLIVSKTTTVILENKFPNLEIKNVETNEHNIESLSVTSQQTLVIRLLMLPKKITVYVIKTILLFSFYFIDKLVNDPTKLFNNIYLFSFYLSLLAIKFPQLRSMIKSIVLFICNATSSKKSCSWLYFFLNIQKTSTEKIKRLVDDSNYLNNSTKDFINNSTEVAINFTEDVKDAWLLCMATFGPTLGHLFCDKVPYEILKWTSKVIFIATTSTVYSILNNLRRLVAREVEGLPGPGPGPGDDDDNDDDNGNGGSGGNGGNGGNGGLKGKKNKRLGSGGNGGGGGDGGDGGNGGNGGGGGDGGNGGNGGGGGGSKKNNFQVSKQKKVFCETDVKTNQRTCAIQTVEKQKEENVEVALNSAFDDASHILQPYAQKIILSDDNSKAIKISDIDIGLNYLTNLTNDSTIWKTKSDFIEVVVNDIYNLKKIELDLNSEENKTNESMSESLFKKGLRWFSDNGPSIAVGVAALGISAGANVIGQIADTAVPGSGIIVKTTITEGAKYATRSATGAVVGLPSGFWWGSSSPKENQMERLKKIAGCKETSYSPVFIYKQKNGDKFKGNLKKFQCDHVNPLTNVRCKREGYIGYKTCWQHMRSDLKVKIKPSTIPEAGKGLFAECPKAPGQICFEANDKIVNYNGQLITKRELDKRYGKGDDNTAPYAIQVGRKYEDAALQRSIGSLINFPSANAEPNVELGTVGNKVVINAIKEIKSGDELFADYGDEYMFDSNYKTTR
jgi:hypothetical protein